MTHTYLIASSVGGSILSIFREQEGERLFGPSWSKVVNSNRDTLISLSGEALIVFRNGVVVRARGQSNQVENIPGRDGVIRSVRVKTPGPIESVSVGEFVEHPISKAEAAPAPTPKAKPAAKAKPVKPKRDTRKPLTHKQREIVDSLKAYQDLHGFSPTYAELQERLGYKHPANIQQHVRLLKKKGYVAANHGKHRSLSLVNA